MWQGVVDGLFITPAAGAPMQPVEAVRAVPGRGLEGDRYYFGAGSFSRWPGPHREVTLIAAEALDEMARETGVVLPPDRSRRNILVRGVPLNRLVKATFTVGAVRLEGLRLCQPCGYLVRKAGVPGLLTTLRDRGGLRARILTEGWIRLGDPVLGPDGHPPESSGRHHAEQ